jgi:hypothetical protein
MGEPRFHYRSDSLLPRRVSVPTTSKPFSVPTESPPTLLTKTSEVGVIGSTYLNTNKVSGNYRTVHFVGYGNVDSMASGLSGMVRVIPRFTGFSPASSGGLLLFGGAFGQPYLLLRALSDGRIQLLATNAAFATMLNIVSVSTHSFTSGTAVDISFTWTGTTAANGAKIYVNGTLLVQGTASTATNYEDAKGQLYETIIPCNAWPQGETSAFDLNECAVWGEVIDPTASGLNLVGPSRTSFISSIAKTAMPEVGEVKSGVTFGYNSTSTGTRTDAPVGNVTSGVQYGAGGTELTGTNVDPVSTDPGVGNVAAGVDYTINDVDLVGELFIGAFYDTLRGFLNYILEFVGSTSLTNDEFDSITLDNPDFDFNLETYLALIPIIEARGEDISGTKERLAKMFESAGVQVVVPEPSDNESEILFGGGVEDSDTETGGYTNVLYGGSIED